MDNKYPTDEALAKAVAANDMDAWSHLIRQYHGRLLNYARSRVSQQTDAEDMVQEAFTSCLESLQKNPTNRVFDNVAGYLFTVLRNTIYSHYRTRWAKSVCLLQDAYFANEDDASQKVCEQLADDDPSVTRIVRQKEQEQILSDALLEALQEILGEYKQSTNFRNLKLCDLVFYSGLPGTETAKILNLPKTSVRTFKHRFLKRLHKIIEKRLETTITEELPPIDLLSELWETHRLTCPKYSTLGNFLLENIEPGWFEYIDFHLTTFGCHFCRASFKDIQNKQENIRKTTFENRIMASTVGFFKKN